MSKEPKHPFELILKACLPKRKAYLVRPTVDKGLFAIILNENRPVNPLLWISLREDGDVWSSSGYGTITNLNHPDSVQILRYVLRAELRREEKRLMMEGRKDEE